ncbi:MAG: hypothetical protein ACJA17_000555 [Polaribacter sp.]|jgi:hypothetical protein
MLFETTYDLDRYEYIEPLQGAGYRRNAGNSSRRNAGIGIYRKKIHRNSLNCFYVYIWYPHETKVLYIFKTVRAQYKLF